MSFSPSDPNPYAAPTTPPDMFNSAARTPELAKLVKDFRSQSLALGVVWVIFGVLAAGIAIFVMVAMNASPDVPAAGPIAGVILGVLAVCWMASGVGTLMKQIWGVYFGLVMSYLALIGNVLNLNICAIVIIIVILVQAHRVLNFANKMRAAGIPLDAKA